MPGGTKENLNHEEIVNQYGEMVSTLCYRLIPDQIIAEEAAQEVWYQVIKGIDNFRGESKISTWIYKIAYRVAVNYGPKEQYYDQKFLKYCYEKPEVGFPEQVKYAKRLWVKEQCDKCLTAMLQCLRPEKKIAYILRDGAELTYKEISDIMEKEEDTIRQIVSRARRKMRKFLNDQCYLYNPDGDCQCRIKRLVKDVNIQQEYDKIYSMIDEAHFYADSNKVMPEKNYWKKFL